MWNRNRSTSWTRPLVTWLVSESFWRCSCRHQLNWAPILLKFGSYRSPSEDDRAGYPRKYFTNELLLEKQLQSGFFQDTSVEYLWSWNMQITFTLCYCTMHDNCNTESAYLGGPLVHTTSPPNTPETFMTIHWRKEKAFTQVLTIFIFFTDGSFDYRL